MSKRKAPQPKPIPNRLVVDVTAEMIATAIPRNSSRCMISDAVRAAAPTATSVLSDIATTRFTDPVTNLRHYCLTPLKARGALLDFDAGIVAEPFRMEIRAAQTRKASRGLGAGKKQSQGKGKLKNDPRSGGTIPVVIGSSAPPIGPVADHGVPGPKPGHKQRGRAFGLRSMVR